ncbi:MAG: DUF503 domain-containing protein [Bacillota bacterium]
MVVGTVHCELKVPWARSLKDKRSAIKGLLDRVRRKFAVAAAEVGALDEHQRCLIGLACVAGEGYHVREVLTRALDYIGDEDALELIDYRLEIL